MKEDWLEGKNEYPLPKDLDLDTVWNEIEDKRKKKKKRRFLIFFFPSVLCIALLMTGMYMSNDSKSSTTGDLTIVQNVEVELNSVLDESQKASAMDDEVESLVVTEEKGLEELESSKKTIFSSRAIVRENVNHEKYIDVISNPPFTTNEKESEIISVLDNNYKPSTISTDDSSSEVINIVILNDNKQVSVLDENSESIMKVEHLNRKIENVISLDMLDLQLAIPLRKLRKRRMPKIKIPFEKGLFVGLRLMGGKADRSFSSSHLATASDAEYVERRNASESVLSSYGADWYIRRTLSPNIFVESGISISSVTVRSNHQYEERSSDQVRQDSAVITHYLNGSVGYSDGDVTAYITETFQSVKYNRLWCVGIPLRVGYMKSLSDKNTLSFSTGVLYNFYASGSGNVIAKDEANEVFTDLSESGYTKNNLLQSTSQLFLNYRMSRLWSLEFGLNYNFDINSRTNSQLVSDKFSSLNAILGIAYKL